MREMGNCVWTGERMLQSRCKDSWSSVAVTGLPLILEMCLLIKDFCHRFSSFFTASIYFIIIIIFIYLNMCMCLLVVYNLFVSTCRPGKDNSILFTSDRF